MKRFIAILILLQIGFIPFCGVFAMESVQNPTQVPDCEMMETTVQTHLSQHSSQLICCTSQTTQEASAQTNLTSDSIPLVVQAPVSVLYFVTSVQAPTSAHTRFKYPPDDFERLSQSKRE